MHEGSLGTGAVGCPRRASPQLQGRSRCSLLEPKSCPSACAVCFSQISFNIYDLWTVFPLSPGRGLFIFFFISDVEHELSEPTELVRQHLLGRCSVCGLPGSVSRRPQVSVRVPSYNVTTFLTPMAWGAGASSLPEKLSRRHFLTSAECDQQGYQGPISAIPPKGPRNKIFLRPHAYKRLVRGSCDHLARFCRKSKTGGAVLSLGLSAAPAHLPAVQARPLPPGKEHGRLFPAPRTLGLGRSRLFGNTVESPGLPGVAVLRRSAVQGPSEIGIRLNTGCVFPRAISEESAQRRSLRHPTKVQVQRHRDLPAKSLSDGSSLGQVSAYSPNMTLWN